MKREREREGDEERERERGVERKEARCDWVAKSQRVV